MGDAVASWFYNHDGNRKGPFTPDQINALIQAGVVDEHTKMWSEAVGEWTPLFRTELRALLGDRAILPPEETPAEPASAHDTAALSQPLDPSVGSQAAALQPVSYPLRDNRVLAKVLWGLLWVNAAISAIQGLWLLKAKGGAEEKYRLIQWAETHQTLVTIIVLPFLATIIVFSWWKYRSTANLFRLRGPQTITPAGAIYWYFVPVAWFWKPYEAMRNLHNGYGAGVSSTLLWWWLLFWGSIGVAAVLSAIAPDPVRTLSEAQTYVSQTIVLLGVEFLWCYVAAELVKAISTAEARALGQG